MPGQNLFIELMSLSIINILHKLFTKRKGQDTGYLMMNMKNKNKDNNIHKSEALKSNGRTNVC